MKDFRVRVTLTTDTKGATKGTNEARQSFGAFFAGFAKFSLISAGVTAALDKITDKVGEWVKASQIQQDAVNALNSSLSKFGPEADSVSAALQRQASELQSVTRFGDEATIAAQAQLATFAKSGDAIQLLTIAAQDFATAQGIDLVNSAKLLGKTLGSQTNALIRYGIEVEGAAGSSERLESLTGNIATLFGGRAQDAAATYAGVMERVSNAQGDFAENLGGSITGSRELLGAQRNFARELESVNERLTNGNGLLAAANFQYVQMKRGLLELGVQLGLFGSEQKKVTDETSGLNDALKEEVEVIEDAEEKMRRLTAENKALTEAQTALEKAANKVSAALGTVTSRELSQEIFDLTVGLEAQKEILGANSDEFIRLEQTASARIEILQARIASLRDGLGDLKESSSTSATGIDELSSGFELASGNADRLGGDVDRLRGRFDSATISANRFNAATQGSLTARDRRSQTDVNEALAAGRTPNRAGTRIRTADGSGGRLLR